MYPHNVFKTLYVFNFETLNRKESVFLSLFLPYQTKHFALLRFKRLEKALKSEFGKFKAIKMFIFTQTPTPLDVTYYLNGPLS